MFLAHVRTRNAGRDNDDIGTSQSVLQAVVFGEISSDFLTSGQLGELHSKLPLTYRNGRNV